MKNSQAILNFIDIFKEISLYIAVIITIISGYDYFKKNKAVIRTDR
jgi:CDP-diacylglycerol--glycerol-3-phosphate 3-phosphatidyltransferase